MTDPSPYSSILRECARIADERGASYGTPEANFGHISEICQATFGLEISPVAILKVMVATKLSRDLHKPQSDNLLDCINYIAMVEYLRSKGGVDDRTPNPGEVS